MVAYKDPNYDRFVASKEIRYSDYKTRKNEIKKLKKEKIETYKANKQKLIDVKKEKQKEGMNFKLAHDFITPSLKNLKSRHKNKLEDIKRLNKENRMIIFPFRLFYKPIIFNDNYLLKHQGTTIVVGLILLVIFGISFYFCNPNNVVFNFSEIGTIFGQLFGPQGGTSSFKTRGDWWAYMGNTAIPLIWDTFVMMFVATTIGAIVTIPFMILCATNIIKNRVVTSTMRVILNIIRTFPTVVLAIIGVAFFGISELAGIFAMIIFTAGIMIKIMFEFIETVNMNPYEASISTGASKPKAFVIAIVPQIIPQFLSNFLYTFEINIRASVVLGLVGAGGIGTEISNAVGMYQYNKIGAILVPLFILVFILQVISNEVKKRTM